MRLGLVDVSWQWFNHRLSQLVYSYFTKIGRRSIIITPSCLLLLYDRRQDEIVSCGDHRSRLWLSVLKGYRNVRSVLNYFLMCRNSLWCGIRGDFITDKLSQVLNCERWLSWCLWRLFLILISQDSDDIGGYTHHHFLRIKHAIRIEMNRIRPIRQLLQIDLFMPHFFFCLLSLYLLFLGLLDP